MKLRDSEGPLPANPARRHVEGHPAPDAPSIHQVYACEAPELIAVGPVLWHSDCRACMIDLQARVATHRGLVLMAHGATEV